MAETRHTAETSPQMLAAVASQEYGAVVRLARRRLGLTQEQLGARTGYSAATISRFETGQQLLHDIGTLRILVRELRIPPAWLGLSPLEPGLGVAEGRSVSLIAAKSAAMVERDQAGEDESVQRRQFLLGVTGLTGAALIAGQGEPADATTMVRRLERLLTSDVHEAEVSGFELARALATAQRRFAACQYNEVSASLPSLVSAAKAAAVESNGSRAREDALVRLADSYLLMSELAVKINQDDMGWVAADRALEAAKASGQPIAVARASRAIAIAMRRQGRHESAVNVLTRAALNLEIEAAPPTAARLSTYSALLCTASYACAQGNKRHDALDLIEEAQRTAGRVPHDAQSEGTPAAINVSIYRIGIHNALGEPGTALEHARAVNPRLLPTSERHARFCIDTARAWEQFGDRDRAVQALLVAERAAPQEIRRPSIASKHALCGRPCAGRAASTGGSWRHHVARM
ncbi:helix-turn-helix transcriptional regulator [Nonomuraea sp. NPDC048916]|uniref:helix-turn-helix domain-containing protein n=1 Tax=Nonomuraea sp. NPDC048916 TaxID=3154232 RepID=UPI0033DEB7E6